VNAALLAAFDKGNESAAADRMIQFWTDAANSKLYQNWWGGVIAGLFTAGGIYDNSPLYDFLTKEFSQHMALKRELAIGITDVLSGQYANFEEDKLENDDTILNVLFASFAFPGFFPPAEAFDSKWFDGSAVYDIDIFKAINKCEDNGYAEENIVIDVVLTSSAELKQVEAEDYKSIGMLFRYLEISSYYSSMDGLLRAKFSYPKANFRYAISPTATLPSSKYPLVIIISLLTFHLELG
jgi:predicted acylesterase/phospholipase RssA